MRYTNDKQRINTPIMKWTVWTEGCSLSSTGVHRENNPQRRKCNPSILLVSEGNNVYKTTVICELLVSLFRVGHQSVKQCQYEHIKVYRC